MTMIAFRSIGAARPLVRRKDRLERALTAELQGAGIDVD
jgi:hypothetical protein